MTSIECFDAINVALRNLKGVADAVRNIQNEEILKLFDESKSGSLLSTESQFSKSG